MDLDLTRHQPTDKIVLGLSLGSSRRDHVTSLQVRGHAVRIYRKGTDGDFRRLLALYRRYDGQVDAFGLGGAELSVRCGTEQPGTERDYVFRQGREIRAAIRRTPLGDGNRVKHLLERRAVAAVAEAGIPLQGAPTLCVSAVDRLGLARALVEHGCRVTFGDLIFSLGLPLPLHSLTLVNRLGRTVLPLLTQLPFSILYPTGERQDRAPRAHHRRYLEEAQILAGDFNWLRENLPPRLDGKVLITNTTTAQDVALLRECGLKLLVTGTPRLEGRTFGTNVIEALLLALLGKPEADVTDADIVQLVDELPLRPALEWLAPDLENRPAVRSKSPATPG